MHLEQHHEPAQPARLLLRTRNLCKNYGNYKVLDHLALNVREGQIYGFLGRNGAGKTTTIQILMGIQKTTGGTLELFGEAVRKPTILQKQRIGYVSQEQFFYSWMNGLDLGRFVRGFFPTWDDAWFASLLNLFNLPPKRKVAYLSQGMKVKLALALALAHRPKLLILDEPTSGLDPAARREFLEIVSHQARAEGITTFFSSHIVEEVERIANRIGILQSGRLLFQGPLEILRDSVRRFVPLAEVPRTEFSNEDQLGGRQASHEFIAEQPYKAFQLLARDKEGPGVVLHGEPSTWQAMATTSLGRIERLSLEDIFLALTLDREMRP